MKLNVENINFMHTTNILEEKLSFWILTKAIIPTFNNSQTNVRNVEKIKLNETKWMVTK